MSQKINRRQMLRASMVGGVGLLAASCSPQPEPAQPTAPPPMQPQPIAQPQAAPTQQPITQPATQPTAAPATPANPAVNTALAAGMVGAANTFLNSLTDDQRTRAMFALSDAERLRWHWTTTSGFPRNGLVLRDMQPAQREAALALLRSSVSETGFKKSMDIMQLQPEIGGDPANYWVSLFGKPGDATWGWRFEGHHLSRHFTIAGDKITITPFFHGVWPSISAAGKAIMQREEWAARELVKSLEDKLRAQVIFAERALTRHVTWNEAYVQPLEAVGAPLSALNPNQQALAMEVIQAWMSTQAQPVAQAHLDRINTSKLDDIRFGWAGSLEERRPHYYRLQGPSFLMEYDNTRNGGIHIHSVWRVFDEDFGQGLV